MIIQSKNDLHLTAPRTFLTNLEVSGTNVLRWKNPAGFVASWGIQVGETGEEQTEVVLLGTATVSGTAGTLTANTLYEHPADTPLYGIKYDQVVFERSTTGTTGTATPMTSGTVTYQADSIYTIFDDTSGSSTYGYRTYFKNSAGAAGSTTTESDWWTSAGLTFYSLGNMRQRVKDRLWNASFIPNDLMIDNWINEWKDELTNSAIQANDDYAIVTVDVSFGTAGLGTITSTDFKQVRRFWVTYNSTDYFVSRKMTSIDFRPDEVFVSTQPKHNWQGDTIFQVHPSDSIGTARIEYYKINPALVNDTDELPTPMRAYTKSFVEYAEAQALGKDEKWDAYDRKMGLANSSKLQFVFEVTPRDKSGATYIRLVEPVDGGNYYP